MGEGRCAQDHHEAGSGGPGQVEGEREVKGEGEGEREGAVVILLHTNAACEEPMGRIQHDCATDYSSLVQNSRTKHAVGFEASRPSGWFSLKFTMYVLCMPMALLYFEASLSNIKAAGK